MRFEQLRGLVWRILAMALTESQVIFVAETVLTLAKIEKLTYNALARAMRGRGSDAACLSEIHRAIGSLPAAEGWGQALTKLMLQSKNKWYLLIVDWTEVGGYRVLVTAIALRRRALPILWTVISKQGDQVEAEGLHYRTLRELLPEDRKFIITADRAYGHARTVRYFRLCNFSFVLRTSTKSSIASPGCKRFRKLTDIGFQPGDMQDFGIVDFAKSNTIRVRVIRSGDQGHKEPWILLTDLDAPARLVVRLYSHRFRIEGFFRDVKSTRFGFGLRGCFFSKADSVERLFGVASIASWVYVLVGGHARKRGWHLDYQSNHNPKELAGWRLGVSVLRDEERAQLLTCEQLWAQVEGVPLKMGQWDWHPRPNEILKEWPKLTGLEVVSKRRRVNRTIRPCDIALGKRLRELIAARGITIKETARRLHRKNANVSAVLTGAQAFPLAWLPQLAEILGLSPKEVLTPDWTPVRGKRGSTTAFSAPDALSPAPGLRPSPK